MYTQNRQKGSTLVLAIMFLAMFSALAAAMATLSAGNVQIAHTYSMGNTAYRAAESGVEVMRYWLSRFKMPRTTPTSDFLPTIVTSLQNDRATAGVTQIVVEDDGSIPAVSVDSASGTTFSAQLQMDSSNPNVLHLLVTGSQGRAGRTIDVAFEMSPYSHPIFGYGMATKGPIHFPENATMTGATVRSDANVYIDAAEMIGVMIGGNATFDGDFHFRNVDGQISYSGSLEIAGDAGQTAVDNHVFAGAEPLPFPTPETDIFRSYATGPVVDPTTMNLTKGLTLTNATIPAGTNPTFSGSVIIEGVLLIESPNVVTFGRNCLLNGIIIGDGNSGAAEENQITFAGNFATGAYPTGEEYAWLATAAGTSILAPVFSLSLTGNFSVIDGVVAVGGLYLAGNASAEVKGTLINYGTAPTIVNGNIALNFSHMLGDGVPAGFDTDRVLAYDPTSYAMVF